MKGQQLSIEPRPSPGLGRFLLAGHGLALLAVAATAWPLWSRLALSLAVLAALARAWRCHQQRRGSRAVRRADWRPGGGWTLTLGDHRRCRVRLLPDSLCLPWLVVLRFQRLESPAASPTDAHSATARDGGGPRGPARWSLILPRDALPTEHHRRLRVQLHTDSHSLLAGPKHVASSSTWTGPGHGG